MQQNTTSIPNKSIQPIFYLGVALMAALFVAMPEQAFASVGDGGGLPYEGPLGQLRASVTGPVAFTVSMIGIVVAGCTLILAGGDVSGFFRTMVIIVLIVSIIIGAQNLMSTFFGRGAEIALIADSPIHQAKVAVQPTGRLA